MLTNRYFIAVVVILLVGAVGYNVWFFFLSEEEGRPSVARIQGAAGGGSGAAPTSAGSGTATGRAGRPGGAAVDTLVSAASAGRPGLRSEEELAAIRRRAGRLGRMDRDPLARAERGGAEQPSEEPRRVPVPDWEVSAIVAGEQRRSAVIDGRAYREGDRIDGGVIEEIRLEEVVVRWRGRRITLEVRGP